MDNQLTININEAASLVGVSPATIRNWEKAGLITPRRKNNKYRVFTMADIAYLKEIKLLSIDQHIGLPAVRSILSKKSLPVSTPQAQQLVSKEILGARWKKYRQKRGISIVQVAQAVGISPSYLTKIENAQANVSFEIVERLAKFYGENMLYYYEPQNIVEPVRSSGKTEKFTIGLDGVLLTARSTLQSANLKVMTYTIEPLCGRMEANTHHGEEFIYVLEGIVQFTLGEEKFILNVGDSLHYQSTISHKWENPQKDKASKMLWVYTGGEV